MSGANQLVFIPEKIESSHIFRREYTPNNIVCDGIIRIACQEANMKGTMFRDAIEFKRLLLEGTEI